MCLCLLLKAGRHAKVGRLPEGVPQNCLYLFTKRERSLISSALKKSSFLKSTLLPNFAFDVIHTGNKKNCNKNNIWMMFK